jgi:hypothetical protein
MLLVTVVTFGIIVFIFPLAPEDSQGQEEERLFPVAPFIFLRTWKLG